MTDRELLRLAAIACAELRGEWVNNEDYFDGVLTRWNPLNDDGDALRLATTVGMSIKIRLRSKDVRAAVPYMRGFQEFFNDNPAAAIRRAIVRAAAEMGRAMP